MSASTDPHGGAAGAAFGGAAYWRGRTEHELARFAAEIARHGYALDPALALIEDVNALYCYYDLERRVISIGLPDFTTPIGRYRWLAYLRMMCVTTIDDAASDADEMLRFVVAHEASHHLRHHYGTMATDDDWSEEHAVNILAVSFLRTLPDWVPWHERVTAMLARMRAGLEKRATWELVDATHDDLEEVLFYDMKVIPRAAYDAAFEEAARRGVPVMQVVRDGHLATAEQIAEASSRQREARAAYNRDYMKDVVVYWQLSVAQMQVELVDPDLPAFDRALAVHLGAPRA